MGGSFVIGKYGLRQAETSVWVESAAQPRQQQPALHDPLEILGHRLSDSRGACVPLHYRDLPNQRGSLLVSTISLAGGGPGIVTAFHSVKSTLLPVPPEPGPAPVARSRYGLPCAAT